LSDSRGFTLIELLVVIAIIGILSSVVLASLSTARNKGKDAAIRSELASLRTEAEIYASSNSGNYAASAGTSCSTAPWTSISSQALMTRIGTDNGENTDVTCDTTASAWAAQAQLIGSTAYVCVDSSGKVSDKATAHTITDQACD
jgi:prepilin-type N-terminal cleavage/methylation domain-containing protein